MSENIRWAWFWDPEEGLVIPLVLMCAAILAGVALSFLTDLAVWLEPEYCKQLKGAFWDLMP